MKKSLLFIIPMMMLGITACKKLGTTSLSISNEDAAAIIGSSLAANSNGLVSISSDIALSSQSVITNNIGCGVTKVDSISRQSAPNAETVFGFKAKFSNKLTCNANNQPDNVTNMLTYSGYINSPRIFITNTGSTNFTIAGLTPAATVYAINGTYNSFGSFKVKADTTKSGTAVINITIKNLLISKTATTATIPVTGGTATLAITGNSPKKGAFTFNGSLTINSITSATLNLNGTLYTINLITGVAVKQ